MGAGLAGAHARLAAIDAESPAEKLDAEVLGALLDGAGHSAGLLVNATRRDRPAVCGIPPFEADREALAALTAVLGEGPLSDAAVPRALAARLTGSGAPRVFPLRARDENVAILFLPGPPDHEQGFASLASHAASVLGWVRLSDRVRSADFELRYRVWELESLYDVGLSIAGTLDLESLADDILLKSVSLLNARSGTLVVRRTGEDGAPFVRDFGSALVDGNLPLDLPDGVLVLNDRGERPGMLAGAQAEKLLAVPIRSDGKGLGLLVVGDKENRKGGIDDFGEADARILSLFANQAAIALENARLHREAVEKEKIEREIELAASIQRVLLPSALPDVPGLELAGGNRPTRQVGGDYFDVLPLPDGSVVLCVADVSGKGVPAALLVSTVHACVHLLLDGGGLDLPSLVARLNRHLYGFSVTRKYATLFLARYEPATRTLRWVNAGHNPGLLLSGEGLTLLESGGVPVGMLPGVTHPEERTSLAPGDLLVLYSDGITEANDPAEEEFGMERLTRLVRRGVSLPAAQLSASIFDEVSRFAAGQPQYDDQTVLLARVR